MAEKEERILIDILPPASGFGSCGGFYTEGDGEYFCCWNGEKERITEAICNNCPHDKSMTRQEAINRMAKSIFQLRFAPLEIKGKKWDDLNGWQKGNCLRIAEAALNALLSKED